MVEENKGQWNKNLAYWFADGSIVLRVENILYKIHISMLTKLSPDMGGILAIPDGKFDDDPTREGTEQFPLLLPGLSIQEFEDLLYWVYRVEWKALDDAEKERVCTNLLKVSDLWQIEVGRAYAIDALQTIYLPPSRRLELAGKYSIHHWVEGAVAEIFSGKLTDLSEDDLSRIGLKVYSILVKGMHRMEIEMRRTANVEPAMTLDPDWQCKNHSVCIAAWKRLWWDRIGRKLLHPDSPIKTDAILAEVKKLTHKDLNDNCRKDMVREIETNVEFVDKRVIAGVGAAIITYNKNL
ncbi:hypothetical protein DFH07DRAFT_780787 [Mycena maculata]|uniref:BTB domain-containing protein n=1 Tax=Mycena maculata TaxID=230809 RepID=A0AAD7I1E8_9AGAR|nr:hypothetical protein DFH07DRAFT_780787 [Mycena maculata]